MRVHVLDCNPMRPIGARCPVPTRCLLLELDDRLVLVDAGLSTADVADPHRRLGRAWVIASRPTLDPNACAARQVEALGLRVEDVRDVVLTHLDLDHVGGVSDFPDARIHVSAIEADAARASVRRHGAQRARYRSRLWRDNDLHEHPAGTSTWQGIAGCVPIPGLEERVLLVPLPGHSVGHHGVAIRVQGNQTDRWLLHAGDALFEGLGAAPDWLLHAGSALVEPVDGPRVAGRRAPLVVQLFDWFIADSRGDYRRSRALLQRIASESGPDGRVAIISSHAPI